MKTFVIFSAIFALAVTEHIHFKPIPGGLSGKGITTRYWDCCKSSCAWRDNVATPDKKPVKSCLIDGVTPADINMQSGCNKGGAYMCNSQQPWVVNATLGYGFADASFAGGLDNSLCCACFKLDFTDQLVGKSLVLQVTNSGTELGKNQFDIALPGGGVGIWTEGCHNQWNAPWTGWGQQYGGISRRDECLSLLPKQLQSGCLFRFDFMQNANNPSVQFTQVECPAEIVAKSGCNLHP